MGNILENISKDNTRFTIFENDQVLTADQLNDLFNFLDVQSRITRTQAIGVGIICGLEIGMLENKEIVLSKGSAITTDGDLLLVQNDLKFDQYELFEDVNAHYPFFRMNNEQVIPLYGLSRSEHGIPVTGKELAHLEETSGTVLQDYVGILYLEDYNNDPDICTGTDCDNKGIEASKELKVVLINKNNIQLLLQSIPPSNKEYFSMTPISVPRIRIQTTINTFQELRDAFNNVLSVKEVIKQKLVEAYQVCKLMLDDEFESGDPTSQWNTALDTHFNIANTIYAQYLYDFVRDLSYAYNEMRETLFSGHGMCCPDVGFFPKHVLLGEVKPAFIKPSTFPTSPISSPLSSPITASEFRGIANTSISARLLNNKFSPFKLHFDAGTVVRRFNRIHIDLEYRHRFYESPILNQGTENIQETRFCFMRINSLIKNFKVPAAEEIQNVEQSLKITPSHFEDKPLGDRSIPFYYRFTRDLPVNLYWNFKANVRKKEDQIYSYNSIEYSNNPSIHSPLLFDILPFGFFRVEGHIGFKYQEVERVLDRLILEHNLPFNVITVQVERIPDTIPRRPWYFPEVYLQEAMVRNTFLDHLNQVDFVNTSLKEKTQTPELENTNLNLSITSFSNAKNKLLTYQPMTKKEFNIETFQADVKSVIDASTDVKAQTKKYDFAHTAVPHDFVINTDIVNKADLIADLIKKKEDKKKEDLMLGNFMKRNPGLEHAGGVLRGGTFVLAYTSHDEIVVADFMLPYFVTDKDIVPEPPVIKPLPIPEKGKLDLNKIFLAKPLYQVDIEAVTSQYDEKFIGFKKSLDNNEKLFDKVVKINVPSGIQPGIAVNPVANSEVWDAFYKLKMETEALSPEDPLRSGKEMELVEASKKAINEMEQQDVTSDPQLTLHAKGHAAELYRTLNLTKTVDPGEVSALLGKVDNMTFMKF
ncbi:MAG: hypothetical protein WD426_12710 [Anditalea sp.]